MSDTTPEAPSTPPGASDPRPQEPEGLAAAAPEGGDEVAPPPNSETEAAPPAADLPAAPAPERLAPAASPPRRAGRHALIGLLAGALGAGLAIGAFALWFDRTEPAPEATTTTVDAGAGAVDAAAVARKVLPSIVTVEVALVEADDFAADGSGSGVVLTADGLLVTNEHVVAGAAEVRVVFADGRIYKAEVVGSDAMTDLAVLRIPAAGLTPITLGSSERMHIGDPAIAVGSPLGLEGGPSVTVGVVSAFGRQLRTGAEDALFGLIQTDAPITRGSSGGALVDSAGRLIGITAAIGISDVGAEGLGFAIPVELMSLITNQIIADGAAEHPFLGIEGSTYFREASDGALAPAGVVVSAVFAATAAEAAGVETGDIILSVDGETLSTMDQLVVVLRFYRVGQIVELEIDRGGLSLTIPVTLMERPEGV